MGSYSINIKKQIIQLVDTFQSFLVIGTHFLRSANNNPITTLGDQYEF